MKQGGEVLGGLRNKFIQISGIEFARKWYLRHLLCARHLKSLLSFNPHGSNPVRQKYHPNFMLEQAKAQRWKQSFSHLEFIYSYNEVPLTDHRKPSVLTTVSSTKSQKDTNRRAHTCSLWMALA